MGATTFSKLIKKLQKITLWPYLVILALWIIFASPYLVKGLIPFPSKYLVTFFPPWSAMYGMPVKNNAMPDVITQIYPWKKLTIDTWKQGSIPLWNPYSFAGTVHAGNYQSAVFSPLNLLFFLFHEVDAWAILVLLQPLLAGIFMLWFLKSLSASSVGVTVGSIAFMFCGFMVVWMAYATLGYALLWLPLGLFAIRKGIMQGSWWYKLTIAASVALSFLSGHFQVSFYVLGFILLFLLFETIQLRRWHQGVGMLLFVMLGLAVAAPQLLLSFEAYNQSTRGSFVQNGSIPWRYLITFFAPDFYGNPVTRNDWFGFYAEWASYIGVIPILLALYAIGGKKSGYVWFFTFTALATILLATVSPVSIIFFSLKLPVISTSAGNRIIALTSFSLAVLSAFGLDALTKDWESGRGRKILIYSWSLLLVLGALWGILLIGKPLPLDKLAIAKRNMLLPTGFLLGFVVLTWLSLFPQKRLREIFFLSCIMLVGWDMTRYAAKWMPFDPREYIYPNMGVTTFLQKTVKEARVFGNLGNELSNYFGIGSLEGYDALYAKRYGEFISSLGDGRIGEPERSVVTVPKGGKFTEQALQLLGVRYYAHRLSDGRNVWAYPYWNYPAYRSVYKDAQYEVFENTLAFPRAFLVSKFVEASDPQRIVDLLWSGNIRLSETVVLEGKPQVEPKEGNGRVEIVSSAPSEVVLHVQTDVPKLLFLSDSYEDGWQATIDEVKTPLYRADYAFQAIGVSAGNHAVRFIYRPWGFTVGMILAIGATGILVLGSIKKIYEDRRL